MSDPFRWHVVFTTNRSDYCREELQAKTKREAIEEATKLWLNFVVVHPSVSGFRLENW